MFTYIVLSIFIFIFLFGFLWFAHCFWLAITDHKKSFYASEKLDHLARANLYKALSLTSFLGFTLFLIIGVFI